MADVKEKGDGQVKIWKYQLALLDTHYIDMPAGARLVDVQIQGDDVCVWALCDESKTVKPRNIAIYGTGNPMPDDPGEYIATFQMDGGSLVFHAFDLGLRA